MLTLRPDPRDLSRLNATLDKGAAAACRRVGAQMLAFTRQAYLGGGANPETGALGFWPERRVPDNVQDALKAARKEKGADLSHDEQREVAAAHARKLRLPSGAARRIRTGGKILFDTGRLFDSITVSQVVKDGDGGYSCIVGTNVSYAKWHQQPWGGTALTYRGTAKQGALLRALGFRAGNRPQITLPARRIFVTPKPWVEKCAATAAREIGAVFGKGG